MVAQRTVVRFEGGDIERMQPRTIAQLKRTIEDAGVEFYGFAEKGHASIVDVRLEDGSGVRLETVAIDKKSDEVGRS